MGVLWSGVVLGAVVASALAAGRKRPRPGRGEVLVGSVDPAGFPDSEGELGACHWTRQDAALRKSNNPHKPHLCALVASSMRCRSARLPLTGIGSPHLSRFQSPAGRPELASGTSEGGASVAPGARGTSYCPVLSGCRCPALNAETAQLTFDLHLRLPLPGRVPGKQPTLCAPL